MSTHWHECNLGDVLALQRGFDMPERRRIPGEVPVVSSSGITGYHDVAKVRAPGVVTGRYGTLGEVHYVTVDFWPLNTTLFVKDFKGNHPRFISYFLRTLNLSSQNVAGAVPGVNRNYLYLLKVLLPSLPTQRKIAAILSAYDDLIENNLRRIKILEEMAQALYREWFVKFRFPGHEQARFVDSPLGRIPEGWEVKRLADVCDLTMGQSPRSEYYNAEGIGLPFHQGVTDFGDRYPTERLYCTVEGRVAEKGDILFSVRAPVGRINIATTKIVIGRGLSAIRHRAGFQWFAYHLLKESFREEDSMGGGTIFKSVTRSDMEGISFLSPELPPLQQYERLVEPMEIQIEDLTRKNSNLRRTRDLLLPKLVSGEVDVSELDIAVPEAVGA